MNPSENDVLNAIKSGSLISVLRGELCRYITPTGINDDMLPTDHAELLEHAIHPLALRHGIDIIQQALEQAVVAACSDAQCKRIR